MNKDSLRPDKGKILIFTGFIIALILRIYDIEGKNMWFDEVYSWNTSMYGITGIIKSAAGDIHPPFFYMALKVWTMIFGDSVIAMRMLSVTLSMGGLYFTYLISRKVLKDNVQVFFVIILYAFSPINLHYAQEVRMFMLNTFLCLGSVYFFMELLENPSKRKMIIYAGFTILAIYTHYFAFLVLFTEMVIVAFYQLKNKKEFSLGRRFGILFIIIIAAYIPWMYEFFTQVSRGQPWRTQQEVYTTIVNAFAYFREIFLSYFIYYKEPAIYKISNGVILTIVLTYFTLLIIAIKRKLIGLNAYLITLFFIIPLIIAVIVSYRNSLLLSRYISIIIPYLLISLTAVVFALNKRKLSYVIMSTVLLVSIVGTTFYYQMNFKNNDYREIISHLEEKYTPGDIIIAEPHYLGWVIKYHNHRGNTDIPAPSILSYGLQGTVDSVKNSGMDRVWFVMDYSSMEKTGYDELPNTMSDLGYSLKDESKYDVIPDSVKVYYFVKE